MEQRKAYYQDQDGYDHVTHALMDLANSYPGLKEGEQFIFSELPHEDGLSIVATSGSFIIEERESIIGHVWQKCAYPFSVVFRASGLNAKRKMEAKEWLDTFASWLTCQDVMINGQMHKLDRWPDLTGDREIRNVLRQSPTYLASINEDKSEDWVTALVIQYRNEFDR
jgi:hypothetical protein